MERAPDNLSEFYDLLQRQDRKAFSAFYDQYAGALYGEITEKVNIPEQAENILLQVFLHAYRELPNASFEHRRLFTWMLLITRSHLRSK